MEKKKKLCNGCHEQSYIWKNYSGNKYCKNCWGKIKSQEEGYKKLIPRVSAKRQKKDIEYLSLRSKHLEKIPICQINVKGCTNIGTDIHHTYAGANRDAFYLIQSTWLVTCRNCHNYIHNNPKESRVIGWLK